jgi:hypothetical protein
LATNTQPKFPIITKISVTLTQELNESMPKNLNIEYANPWTRKTSENPKAVLYG